MNAVTDISTSEDIKLLVDTFYEKVRHDELLAPIFNGQIQGNWTAHLEKMVAFWRTVLLDEHAYQGSPFPPHAQLPITHLHFERWMEIFTLTVDTLFKGPKADDAKWRAGKMAEMFQSKIEFYKARGFKHLL